MRFDDIQPGDIGFDGGKGIFGWLIRRVTGSRAHCWVYVKKLASLPNGDEIWLCDEAGPKGVQERIRQGRPLKCVRLWRTSSEQLAIIIASAKLLGTPYAWTEIARIFIHRLTGRTWDSDPKGVICSEHVALTIAAARPDLRYTKPNGMPYPAANLWPDALANWADIVMWREHTLPTTQWQKDAELWFNPATRHPF